MKRIGQVAAGAAGLVLTAGSAFAGCGTFEETVVLAGDGHPIICAAPLAVEGLDGFLKTKLPKFYVAKGHDLVKGASTAQRPSLVVTDGETTVEIPEVTLGNVKKAVSSVVWSHVAKSESPFEASIMADGKVVATISGDVIKVVGRPDATKIKIHFDYKL